MTAEPTSTEPEGLASTEPEEPADGARPPAEADLGSSTGGVWTRADVLACGLSDDTIEYRVALGIWQRVRRGVYCDGGVVPSPAMRGWTAVLASGGVGRAWADGRTTLRLFDLPLIDDDDPATGAYDVEHDDVIVSAQVRPRGRATLHPHRGPRRFEVGTVHGCPSVSLEESLFSAARVLTHEALVCVLDAALHRGALSTDRLDRLLARSAGRRHVVALRRAVALADGRAESPAETLCRLLLLPHLPGLVPQVKVFDRAARIVARLDLGDEELGLAVESDGRERHAGDHMVAKDRRRDARTESFGWTTERCTWFELRREQAQLVKRVLTTADRLRRRSGRG